MKNIFRKITALLPRSVAKSVNNKYFAVHLRSFFFLFLAITAFASLQLLVFLNFQYRKANFYYQQRNTEFSYWSAILQQYPNVPDVLYNASLSAFNVGRKDKALGYIDKALQIDPTFKKAQELKDEISK